VQITEAICEWDYGEYEGLTSKQIQESRKQKGLGPWDIWRDGCPGGEYVYFSSFFSLQCYAAMQCNAMSLAVAVTNPQFSARSPEDVKHRLDALISEIKEKHHRPGFEHPDCAKGDVLVVAHGHILRAFAMRWTGKSLTDTSLILEAGGVGTLR
jgi:probable phosphoglycerate mutase